MKFQWPILPSRWLKAPAKVYCEDCERFEPDGRWNSLCRMYVPAEPSYVFRIEPVKQLSRAYEPFSKNWNGRCKDFKAKS